LIWGLSHGWKADLGDKIFEKKSGGQHTPFSIPIRVEKKSLKEQTFLPTAQSLFLRPVNGKVQSLS
jgi:hypothetical protein